MNLSDVVTILEEIAPPELAEDFDIGKIGLTLDLENDIRKIAVALDPTHYVLKRASDIGADLLITHHTLIFDAVNQINKSLADVLKIALDSNISLYSMHTNYDRAKGGINDILARRIGLSNIEEIDIGRIGTISPCPAETFLNHVAKSLDTHVWFTGRKEEVSKVMVFGGSGFKGEFLEIAQEHGVDAYVSAELKHDIIRSWEDILLVDATHYATENPGMEELCPRLEDRLGLDVEFIDHNPFIKTL
ncbi:Nif3-like dinuclear metal center hexameric protein [Methanolobus halotolerans]|uniref:Nif3-like dinuclear metal center hexameric protein n=1 Tax=Methanolobus halotolerans TaxID=2052935 RepID=A0A4E0PVL6_9EURY|nr:Nif3-like dinuclear metal center hexameric protein [Methanolobus halotolerans]TGC09179.1 Nif3-like dinuclear metal center hexameric protein [Methanolobus halotolerans]